MIDLFAFCDRDTPAFERPVLLADGRVGATDTRVGVVCDRAVFPAAKPPESRYPALNHVIDPALALVQSWCQPPELPPCGRCKDSGIVNKLRCDDCRGLQQVQCDLGHLHECESCNGRGYFKNARCPDCRDLQVIIEGRWISFDLARRILRLPAVEFGVDGQPGDAGLVFRFTHGVGVVCPIVREPVGESAGDIDD